MEQADGYQSTVEKLYTLYLEKGFLQEEETLNLMSADGISLIGINRVTDKLIALGVIFADDGAVNEDEDADRAQSNYDAIFNEVLDILPGEKTFIAYIRDVRPPQYLQWRSLITQMNSGNFYAFNMLFDMYLRVVVRMALHFHKGSRLGLNDAIQEGSIGLMLAIRQFDGSKHSSLGSYISFWIHRYMVRAVVNKERIIRLPTRVYKIVKKIKQCKAALLKLNGRDPTFVEIAEMIEMPVETVMEMLEVPQYPIHFDSMLETEEDRVKIEKYCSNQFFGEEFEIDIIAQQVHDALSTLPDREQRILSLRYGLVDGKEWTLDEISLIFGLSRERIRQIEKEALMQLCIYARERRMEVLIEVISNTSLS